jgi:hypothetical protein
MYALTLLLALLSQAGEPSMYGVASTPETTIQATVGESVWLEVDTLTLADLDAGAVYVFPSGCDVGLRVLQDRRGSVIVWFCASERAPNDRGQYDILLVAPIAGEPPTLKRLAWTIRTGAGPQPPPKPPGPGPDPTVLGSRLLVIRETEETTAEEAALILQARASESLSGKLQVLDKDSQDEAGNPSPIVAACLATYSADLPAVYVLDSSGLVIRGVPLPGTVEELEAMVR